MRHLFSSSNKRTIIAASIAIGLLVLLGSLTRLKHVHRYDERDHQRFTQYIAEHPTLHTIVTYEGADYAEAKAPLLFILGAICESALGFSIQVLRLLVMVFGISAVLAFMWLSRCFTQDGSPYWASMVLLPYFMMLSLLYMTDVPTLSFLLISACGYFSAIEKPAWSRLSIAALSMTCAAYIRIDSCYLLGAIGLACLWHRQLNWRMIAALALPVVLRLPLVIAWGGLAAPPAQARQIAVVTGFHAAHFTFVLAVLGFYFWPFALENLWHHRSRLLFAALIAAAGAFFLPVFDPEEVDYYGGLLRSIFVTSHAPPWLTSAGLIVLVFIGSLILLRMVFDGDRGKPQWLALRLVCLIGIAMQIVRGGVMYERYLLQVSPFMLGLLILTSRSVIAIWMWIVIAAAMLLPHLAQQKFFSP